MQTYEHRKLFFEECLLSPGLTPTMSVSFDNKSDQGQNTLKANAENKELELIISSNIDTQLTAGQKLEVPPQSGFKPTGSLFVLHNLDSFLSEEQMSTFINDPNWTSKVLTSDSTKVLVFAPQKDISLTANKTINIKLNDITLGELSNITSENLILQFWDIKNINIIPAIPQSSSFKVLFENTDAGKDLKEYLSCAFDDGQESELKGVQLLITSYKQENITDNSFSFQLYKNGGAPDIKLNEKSKFIVSFIYGENETSLVDPKLVSSSGNYQLNAHNHNWKVIEQKDLQNPSWILELNAEGDIPITSDFTFSHVITKNQPGPSLMYIQYLNIPGFADGYFTMPVKKISPVVIKRFSSSPLIRNGPGDIKLRWDIDWGYGNDQRSVYINNNKINIEENPNHLFESIDKTTSYNIKAIGILNNNSSTDNYEAQVKPVFTQLGCNTPFIVSPTTINFNWETSDKNAEVSISYNGTSTDKLPYSGSKSIEINTTTSFTFTVTDPESKLFSSREIVIIEKLYARSFDKGLSTPAPNTNGKKATDMIAYSSGDSKALKFAYYDQDNTIHYYNYTITDVGFIIEDEYPKSFKYQDNPSYEGYDVSSLVCSNTTDNILILINNESSLKSYILNLDTSTGDYGVLYQSENSLIYAPFLRTDDIVLYFLCIGKGQDTNSIMQTNQPFSNSPEHSINTLIQSLKYEPKNPVLSIIPNQTAQTFFAVTSSNTDSYTLSIAQEQSFPQQDLNFGYAQCSTLDFTGTPNFEELWISSQTDQEKIYRGLADLSTQFVKKQDLFQTVIDASGKQGDRIYGYNYKTQNILAIDYSEFFVANLLGNNYMKNPNTIKYYYDSPSKTPYAFVLSSNYKGKSFISIINLISRIPTQNSQKIELPGTAYSMDITPDGTKAFAVNLSGEIFVLDIDIPGNTFKLAATLNSPSAKRLHHIAVCPNAMRENTYYAYITNEDSNDLLIINTNTQTFLDSINLPFSSSYALHFSSLGDTLIVSSKEENKLCIINLINREIISKDIPTGKEPLNICTSPNEKYIYTANYSESTISIIETSSKTILHSVPVSGNASCVAFYPSLNRLFVGTQNGSGTVEVIDLNNNPPNVIQVINTAAKVSSICISPDGQMVMVLDSEGNMMKIIRPLSYLNS